ncbi:hypothetical protein [Kangiella sediminilitoris]|uniref:Uncharacterized protein n=1 Tax=Kangiella sediminilitoris TaxID=1144748 RepID=A0A1B3B9R3_9GAMM|nr:hypothetical protein [Kangiella sediminilitoris]AOE49527.1 hypothetical protein KS2013_804 [Kangiella sediminilitoris]
MTQYKIKVEKDKKKDGKSIPKLEDKNQETIEVINGDTIKWKYKKGKTITISSNTDFSPGSGNSYSGDEEVTIEVGGATEGNNINLKYNIATSDTDETLDPVIIIKTAQFR